MRFVLFAVLVIASVPAAYAHSWHICLPTYPVGSLNKDFFCFFAPPAT